MELRDLRPLGLAVTVLVALNSLFLPLLLLLQHFAVDISYESFRAFILVMYLAKAVTVITFSVWIYRAGKNLIAAGYEDLEFTPAARIWWFAIPIAALFKPFQGMRELWNASHGDPADTTGNALLAFWWALWLGTGFLSLILGFLAGNGGMGPTLSLLLISGMSIGLAVTAILIVRGINQAQSRLSGAAVAEVFA